MKMMDLEALFRATREGIPGARARLLEAVRARLCHYLSKSHSGDDLVQNAMLIVARKLDRLGPDVVFERWLLRVARNVAYREWELCERRTRLAEAVAHAAARSAMGPSTALSQAELVEILLEEIQQLPDSMRSVIENELVDGDLDALAAEQGVTRGTLRSRRSRAIDRLAARILARLQATAVSNLTSASTNSGR